ncbi:hypothetical protein EJ110_NYTH51784 [Nymphaea thermarum]|nr:hypothetical protein EJ110_NYTH51784 [Nymphaea thermarum]
MSYMNRAVIAAGMAAAVQGLKDQGIRFNSVMRVIHQNGRRNYASSTQLMRVSPSTVDSSPSSSLLQRRVGDERSKEAEESLRKVIECHHHRLRERTREGRTVVKMSSMNRAVIAAGVTAAVQGLKDQGIRFNSVVRVLHQNGRRNYASSTQLVRVSSSTTDSSPSSSLLQRRVGDERSKEAEESLRKYCI